MLAYIYNHNTQCENTTINAPVDDKIKLIISNLKTCEIKILPFMAGRLINFEKYIETLNLKNINITRLNNKFIKIKVKDNHIKQNDSIFKISIIEGKPQISKEDTKHDIELDINSIAQLVFGYLDINEVFMLNEIEKDTLSADKKELLDILFEKKINYIDELI